jgi:hypothetical protein
MMTIILLVTILYILHSSLWSPLASAKQCKVLDESRLDISVNLFRLAHSCEMSLQLLPRSLHYSCLQVFMGLFAAQTAEAQAINSKTLIVAMASDLVRARKRERERERERES